MLVAVIPQIACVQRKSIGNFLKISTENHAFFRIVMYIHYSADKTTVSLLQAMDKHIIRNNLVVKVDKADIAVLSYNGFGMNI